MSYNRKNSVFQYDYMIDNILLKRCDSVTDLGVQFDSKLYFTEHVVKVINEAYRMLGMIIRFSRDFNATNVMFTLFYTFVRSKLEYASIVWSPWYQIHIRNIEKLQSKFLRFVFYKLFHTYPTFMPYRDLLTLFNVTSLEGRRNFSAIMFCFKLFHNIINDYFLVSQFQIKIPHSATRLTHEIFAYSRINSRQHENSPLIRMAILINFIAAKYPTIDFFNDTFSNFRAVISKYYASNN